MAGRRSGIALFTVLVILGLLVMMTTSFVAINHGNFALMTAAADQEEAVGACQAGYSYAFYALEHDRRFGRNFAQGSSPSQAQLDDLSSLFTISVVDQHTLTATMLSPEGEARDASFTIEVANNLPLDSIDTPPAIPAQGDVPKVPPDCVFLRITGTAGGVSRILETMLTYAPVVDASATADNDIRINSSEGITFDSKDRFRNFVRSNGLINLQDEQKESPIKFRWEAMEKELFVKLKDLTKDNTPKPTDDDITKMVEDVLAGRKGDLKAKGDIRLRDKSTTQDVAFRFAQEKDANGHISPNSTRQQQLLDIKFEDFRLGDKTTKEVEIKSGLYVFGSADYQLFYQGPAIYQDALGRQTIRNETGSVLCSLPALERQEVVQATESEITKTKTLERWVTRDALPKEGAGVSNYGVPAPPDGEFGLTFKGWASDPTITYVDSDSTDGENDSEITDRQNIHEIDGSTVKLDDIGVGVTDDPEAIVIDIKEAQFRVRENTIVKTASDFGVLAEKDRFSAYGGPDKSLHRSLDAKIYLGVDKNSMTTPEIKYSEVPSAVQAPGRMRVRNVRGRGALVAGNDLTLAAGGDTKNDELALYSGKDIILDPRANLQGTTSQESEATDKLDTSWDGPANCSFRGLVYARDKFIVGNADTPFDVKIEGSLVARDKINIRNAKKVDLIYNPVFSRRMLKDRPDYNVRLERQSYNLF